MLYLKAIMTVMVNGSYVFSLYKNNFKNPRIVAMVRMAKEKSHIIELQIIVVYWGWADYVT